MEAQHFSKINVHYRFHYDMYHPVAVYQEKSEGEAEVLNVPSILEVAEYLLSTSVLIRNKCTSE